MHTEDPNLAIFCTCADPPTHLNAPASPRSNSDDTWASDNEDDVLRAEEAAEWRHWKTTTALVDPAYDTDHPYYDSSDLNYSD